MSNAKARLEDAIADYVKEEITEGDIVTGWVVGITVRHPQLPNSDGYVVENSQGMPYHSQIGLITAILDEKRNTVLSQIIKGE